MPKSYSSPRSPEYHERDVVTERPRGPRPSVVNNNDYSTVKRRPTGKRIVRAVARFFIAVLIGAGATLAWQSYGDAAKDGQDGGSVAGLVVACLGGKAVSRRSGVHRGGCKFSSVGAA